MTRTGNTAKKTKSSGAGCVLRLFVALAILIVVVWVGAKLFFPTEKVKAEIVRRTSQALHRNVELDGVSFGILPGPHLTLKGFRIYNPEGFPGEPFVSVDNLDCGLKLLPLFKKQFIFSEISVEKPVIRLHKDKSGKVNYSFEADLSEQPLETVQGKKEKVTSEEAAASVFAFDWAAIKNGDLIYVDDSAGSRLTLSNFSLDTRLNLTENDTKGKSAGTLTIPGVSSSYLPENTPLNIELAYNADVDFQHADLVLKDTRITVNGIPFDLEATIRNYVNPISFFARVSTVDVSLEPLLQYLPPSENFDRDQLRLSGMLTGQVEMRLEFADNKAPYINGAFAMTDMTAGYRNIAGRMHFDKFRIEFDPDSISFRSEGGTLSDKPFAVFGAVGNWDDLTFDFGTRGSYDLAGVKPFLDPVANPDIKGNVSFDVGIRGKKSNWVNAKILGSVMVDKLYYTNDSLTSPLDRLDMKLVFKTNRVDVDSLYAEYPGVKLKLTGTVKNGFAHLLEPRKGYKKPFLEFSLYSPVINYDVLLPEEAAPATTVATAPPATSGKSGTVSSVKLDTEATAPIFLPDIEAAGKVVVDTFIFSDVRFTNLTGDLKYDNGLIEFTNATGNVYQGSLKANGTVDINDMFNPIVQSNFTAENVQANDFMEQFTGLGGHVFGKCNLSGNVRGQGSEIDDFMSSLDADGLANLNEGKLINLDIINKLAEKLKFKTFKEEDLRNFSSKIKIRKGSLMFEDTKAITQMGDWKVNGAVAFLKKDLDLNFDLYMSPEYSKKANLMGGVLLDDQGRLQLGFKLTGTYKNPTISDLSLAENVMSKNVEKKLKDEANKLLKDLFKKD